ncbi:MAG: NAD(P)/FAD-dependent oxidoreductase [Cytophagales bacterium]|nr:NAD(P)/FAD-dependent oxidoreductase [Cytophagales bacterium]
MIPTNELSISIPRTGLKRVVVVGGGFAGIEFAKLLSDKQYQVVLLDRHNYHTFQPLLYQVSTAGLEADSIAAPLRQLFEKKKNFHFRMAMVQEVKPEENLLVTSIGTLHYDMLVLAVGSKTNYFGNQDLPKTSFPLKQVPQALDLRSHVLQNFERAVLTTDPQEMEGLMNYVMVGGGPTGVEMAGAFAELKKHVLPCDYPELDFNRMQIYLIEGSPKILGAMSEKSSKHALEALEEMGVHVVLNKVVKSYDGETAVLSDGSTIRSNTLIWAAGVKGNLIPGLREESVFKSSRYVVNEHNRVQGYDNIYALGDIAAHVTDQTPNGLPMVSPVAMQQGRHLARNLNRLAKGEALRPFKYFDKGAMATIGRNRAVVDFPNGLHLKGLVAWLAWMFVHIFYIIGFRSKLVVFANWVWSYFTYDKGTRLIIRPFVKPNNPIPHIQAQTPADESVAVR